MKLELHLQNPNMKSHPGPGPTVVDKGRKSSSSNVSHNSKSSTLILTATLEPLPPSTEVHLASKLIPDLADSISIKSVICYALNKSDLCSTKKNEEEFSLWSSSIPSLSLLL